MEQPATSALPKSNPPRDAGAFVPGASLLLRMLDEMEYGMVLVDGEARLRYSNALGRDEVSGEGPLQLREGVVVCVDMARRSAFRVALADALMGRRQLLTFTTGDTAASIAVTPLLDADDGDLQRQASHALLVFGKRHEVTNLSIDFFARQHKLTSAESAVLLHLARGLGPAVIACRQCVAISTIRSQIASIRGKTRTGSIRELLDCLAMLPPIRTVVRATLRRSLEVFG